MTSELPTGAITGATKCLRVARRGQVVVVEVLLSSSSSGWTWWQRLWRTGVPLASVQAARGIEGCEGNQLEKKVQHFFVFVFLFCKKGWMGCQRESKIVLYLPFATCSIKQPTSLPSLFSRNLILTDLCLWTTIRINTWKIRLVRWCKWVNEGEVPAIGAPGRQFGVSFVFKPALED